MEQTANTVFMRKQCDYKMSNFPNIYVAIWNDEIYNGPAFRDSLCTSRWNWFRSIALCLVRWDTLNTQWMNQPAINVLHICHHSSSVSSRQANAKSSEKLNVVGNKHAIQFNSIENWVVFLFYPRSHGFLSFFVELGTSLRFVSALFGVCLHLQKENRNVQFMQNISGLMIDWSK